MRCYLDKITDAGSVPCSTTNSSNDGPERGRFRCGLPFVEAQQRKRSVERPGSCEAGSKSRLRYRTPVVINRSTVRQCVRQKIRHIWKKLAINDYKTHTWKT